ncbi:FAD-dependent oxidoreductase [Actinomadura macrotermitis]|uniref:6-methylpretetramide 4-monooxygenase n=1 Tax=Actinomadura macrotermitis TaxID=2585200 RepID=A0A7K0BSY9_9ACTN|nr:FAD-dependent oxidoreductase [Actinomadura macrotermitis]MQY04315.1 6-methylpretetramide 4-monooxygenase [Actinomadura macrotermitis]
MTETTTCCIAGGGPAGVFLGLLLARAGVEVTVLEKHGDFLRDFRGDTIHPSTLDVLDELGLGDRFAKLAHRRIGEVRFVTDDAEVTAGDLRALGGRHPYIAMVPQWDLLDMIAGEAARHPGFRLLMNAEATGLVVRDGRVRGLRYRDGDGADHEIHAELTVAADGRNSVLRRAAGLPVRAFGAPMDVAWFRLPRRATDPGDVFMRLSPGHLMAAIDRTDYWQLAYLVPKGGYAKEQARGIPALRRTVAGLLPFLADRVEQLEFADISVLNVRVDRLRRWYRPGFLCIGDAAHAMSPIGGVGVNLAVQDAVATANRLYRPLRDGTLTTTDLAAVQRRRKWPAVVVQSFQLAVQALLVGPVLRGEKPPVEVLRAGGRPLRRAVARGIGYGPLPEHVRVPAPE